MNRLTRELAKFCAAHPLEEKILVAPTFLIGNEIVEVLARGNPVVNLRVKTAASLAADVVAPAMARRGLRLPSRAEELALIEDACHQELRHFGPIADSSGFHVAASSTFRELSDAGLDVGRIRIPENPNKESDLRAIGERLRRASQESGFLAPGELWKAALAAAAPSSAIILLPQHPRISGRPRSLVDSLSGGRTISLGTDPFDGWKTRASSLSLARASGEESEIQRAFRSLASEDVPLDRAEFVCAGADYFSLVFEISSELGLPCTFAEGLPLSYSNPGRAAVGFLQWLERDFEAETLARMAEDGAAAVPGPEAPDGWEVARILRAADIGWGRGRYSRLALGNSGSNLASAESVRNWVESLLSLSSGLDSKGRSTPSQIARTLASLLEASTAVKNEHDSAATRALAKLLSELGAIERRPRALRDAVAAVREIVVATSFASAGPTSGHLHVSSVASAGYTGRLRAFLLGLDSERFPGRLREDPLLSDRDRGEIRLATGVALPARGDRAVELRDEATALLSRLRGKVDLSYSDRDMVEHEEKGPSPIFLEAFREKSGESDADYAALDRAIRSQEAAATPLAHLENRDWWLERIRKRRNDPSAILGAIEKLNALVARGLFAEAARANKDRFSVYDGWVPSAKGRFDPRSGPSISASSIELLARCPFQWFLQKVLRVESPKFRDRDEDRWLDDREFGVAAHEILRGFLDEILASGRRAGVSDAKRLLQRASEHLDGLRRQTPEPLPAAEAAVRRRMVRLCEEFLRVESSLPAGERVVGLEQTFGMPSGGRAAFGSREALAVGLPGGRMTLSGRIDRIDEREDGSLVVYDYKTAPRRRNAEKKGLASGTRIQPALYGIALEELLRQTGDPRRVGAALYYYLGHPSGLVENLTEESRAELPELLGALFDTVAAGAFVHVYPLDKCVGCEFMAACGGARSAARAKAKLAPSGDPLLASIRSVRGWSSGRAAR